MSPIPSYKKQFNQASEDLARDQQELLDLDEQIQALQKKKSDLTSQIEADKNNVVTKGMLYFDSEKRKHVLDEAEQLSYSRMKLDRLRGFDDQSWNSDNVDFETITEFQAMERYISENSPGILSWLGKSALGGGNQ